MFKYFVLLYLIFSIAYGADQPKEKELENTQHFLYSEDLEESPSSLVVYDLHSSLQNSGETELLSPPRSLAPILDSDEEEKKRNPHESFFATPSTNYRPLRRFQSKVPRLEPRNYSASSTESSPGLLSHYRPIAQIPDFILSDLPLPPFDYHLSSTESLMMNAHREEFHQKMKKWKKENKSIVHMARESLKHVDMIQIDLTCALFERSDALNIDHRMLSYVGAQMMQEELASILKLHRHFFCQGAYKTLPAFQEEDEFCTVKIGQWDRACSSKEEGILHF